MPEQAARSVHIQTDPKSALSFLGDVESLPLWTGFYKQRLGRDGDSLRFATPVGESLTRIDLERMERGSRLTIVSAFAVRVERAIVLVEPAGSGTQVTFIITFPDHVPAERRAAMLQGLEGELGRLKGRLEHTGAGVSPPLWSAQADYPRLTNYETGEDVDSAPVRTTTGAEPQAVS